MSLDVQRLFALLPAVLRARDQAQALLTPGWLTPDDRNLYEALQSTLAAGGVLTTIELLEMPPAFIAMTI